MDKSCENQKCSNNRRDFRKNSQKFRKISQLERDRQRKRNFKQNPYSFLNKHIIKRYSRYTSLGAVFAEPFNGTFRELLKRPVFEMADGKWLDVLSTITKQWNDRVHSSTILPTTQGSLKKNEEYVF